MPGESSRPCRLVCYLLGDDESSANNHAGNMVIMGLGASQQPVGHPRAWLQALVAIFFFFFGALFTARVTTFLNPLRHTTLAFSFFVQTALLVTAAALLQSGVIPGIIRDGKESYLSLIVLPMFSFQGGKLVRERHTSTLTLCQPPCRVSLLVNLASMRYPAPSLHPFSRTWATTENCLLDHSEIGRETVGFCPSCASLSAQLSVAGFREQTTVCLQGYGSQQVSRVA